MKKLIFIITLFMAQSIFSQSWWTPRQEKSIDSLKNAIDSLGTIGLPPLALGRLWIGDNAGYPASRTISGDFTINYLGVGAIGASKITNSMLVGSIDATKIGNGSISNTEFSYLDGLTRNVQNQINDITLGTGFITSYGSQTITTNIRGNGAKIRFRASASVLSNSADRIGMPTFATHPASDYEDGDYYQLSSDLYTNKYGVVKHRNGFYVLGYYDEDPLTRNYFPPVEEIRDMIDSVAIFEEASLSNAATDTLDFGNTKIVTDWFGANTAQTVYVVNYQPKTVSCFVQSDEGVTFDFGGKTVKYADGIHLPAFTDQKIYLITMIYSGNIVWISYVEYKD